MRNFLYWFKWKRRRLPSTNTCSLEQRYVHIEIVWSCSLLPRYVKFIMVCVWSTNRRSAESCFLPNAAADVILMPRSTLGVKSWRVRVYCSLCHCAGTSSVARGGAARPGCHHFGVTLCFNLLGLNPHTQRKPTEFSAKTFFFGLRLLWDRKPTEFLAETFFLVLTNRGVTSWRVRHTYRVTPCTPAPGVTILSNASGWHLCCCWSAKGAVWR